MRRARGVDGQTEASGASRRLIRFLLHSLRVHTHSRVGTPGTVIDCVVREIHSRKDQQTTTTEHNTAPRMVVSSTLVNVSEDAELRLVSLLASSAPADLLGRTFQEDCSASISAGDASALLQTVVQDPGAVTALTILSKEEATAAVSILAALLERVAEQEQLVQALSNAVVQAPKTTTTTTTTITLNDSKAALRKISILSIIYNMHSQASGKCALLSSMLRLAGEFPDELLSPESTLGSLLVETSTAAEDQSRMTASPTAVPRLVSLLDSWEVPQETRRQLYQCITEVLPVGDLRKQRFLLLLIASYDTAGDAVVVDPRGLEAAKHAAIGAIRDPVTLFVHQRNLLQQPAVQALQKSQPSLYGLLQVFQEGKIPDYDAFCKSNGGEAALLHQFGLDAEVCQRHMRILSLCSLASEHEEIPYSVIDETLKLESSNAQVESWVIAAVGTGLLQAKMDQLKQTVMVERSVVRKFDMEQWKSIQTRLSSWKQNVGGVLASLKESRAGHAAAVN